jgi:hypothetical protein
MGNCKWATWHSNKEMALTVAKREVDEDCGSNVQYVQQEIGNAQRATLMYNTSFALQMRR